MKKLKYRKQIILAEGLLSLMLLLGACHNEPSYPGTYYGEGYLLSGTVDEPVFLTIEKDQIRYGDRILDYDAREHGPGQIRLETLSREKEDEPGMHFTFNEDNPDVIWLQGYGDQKISMERLESYLEKKAAELVPVELTTETGSLSTAEKCMLPLLMEAANVMDRLFWKQAYGDPQELLEGITHEATRKMILNNYGPWDRLNGNRPFLPGAGMKPAGANFYPADMTPEEFEQFEAEDKTSLYTLVRRDASGGLASIPYHEAYSEELEKASELILQAASLCEQPGLKKYLELRADALLSGDYLPSDLAWMDMKDNTIDFIVGPIENYEDRLYGYKAAFEAFILIKDWEWSARLEKYASMLPRLQKQLPVPVAYKQEVPGSDSDLGVYDAVYYAGDCNAGSKAIAINLPNDERVHIEKGSRKLQLKNAMRYKYDEILVPISELLIAEDQQKHIKFDAFFENTMFHEVAHGMGIKNTLDGKGTVRHALREQFSIIEEGKADILGLFLVTRLAETGELGRKDLMDNYVTFLAGIFRSVRFGAASSHGRANMIRFYFFQQEGAFSRDHATGTYRVDFDKMQQAMIKLAREILMIQGNGDYGAASELILSMGNIRPELQRDLDRLEKENIPVDIIFEQGPALLGL